MEGSQPGADSELSRNDDTRYSTNAREDAFALCPPAITALTATVPIVHSGRT